MPRPLRIALIAALVPVGLALLVGLAFTGDRLGNGGQVLGRVAVADIELGDLDAGDTLAALRRLEGRLVAARVPVTVAGRAFSLDPAAVSFEIDEATIAAQAMEQGREGHLGTQFAWWAGHFFGDEVRRLDMPYTYDEAALAEIIARWEVEGIANPPFPGEVLVADGRVSFRHPEAGIGIEREVAAALLAAALGDPGRAEVALPSRPLTPPLTEADIDAVVAEAEGLLAGEVTLRSSAVSGELVVPAAVLGRSLLVERDDTVSPPAFAFSWDPAPLQDFLQPHMGRLSTEPVNAELLIDVETDEVTVRPSIATQEPDPEALAAGVDEAARAAARTADLPYREGAQPEVTTADIEALGIQGLIGEFTTPHNCCEPRVTNIHLIADATDGALVLPGETFSLNAHVGQRTREKGYVPAPAIIMGELECCDNPINIGGGTSQWTTTLYNAAFFAGLEDVAHTPHSLWISRYPEGREATLGWTRPDLQFRNNTGHAIIIRAAYTDTSVTAKIYGDNGGITVAAGLSGRYNYTGVITRYVANPDLECGTEQEKSAGSGGWSVDVFRYITFPDGNQTTEKWTWHYTGLYHIIERGPDCPEP
ncbi:MAG: VanW family protein [Actinomycetota bacterium]